MKAFVLRGLIAISFFAAACPETQAGAKMIDRTQPMMGTTVQIKAPARSAQETPSAEAAISMAMDEARRVESVFSVYVESSEVSRINRLGPGEELVLSDEAYEIIRMSLEASEKTSGAFDITVKPLVEFWAAAGKSGVMPSKEDIAAARERTGWKNVRLDPAKKTISFLKPGMSVDLGGVAKGYAADAAAKILKGAGIANCIVNCGGDMYCMGRPSPKKKWRVGIRHPRRADRVFLEINVEDMAVDTSGDYEKYFTIGGKRYSHIVDPRTGYPIGDDVVSATVIAPDSATADIYATALCVLGLKSLRVLEAEKLDAMIMLKKGNSFDIKMTKGFLKKYERR